MASGEPSVRELREIVQEMRPVLNVILGHVDVEVPPPPPRERHLRLVNDGAGGHTNDAASTSRRADARSSIRMTPAENPILAREEALTSILLGNSDLAEADEGERAVREAHGDLIARGSGVGFGFIRNLGFDGDKVRLLYAITDGAGDACFQVLISGSQLAKLKDIDDIDEWVYERLPTLDGTGSARYARILGAHPVALW